MFPKFICITIKVNKKLLIIFITFIIAIFMMIILRAEFFQPVFKYHNNKVIVIDPGHGGIDGGTSDRFGLLEKHINLDVALKLRNRLRNKNFRVIMTRNKDVSLENKSHINDSRYKKDLDARKKIINNSGAAIFVSIHVNADPNSTKTRGVEIFYYPTSVESENLAREISTSINYIVYKNFLNENHIKAKVIGEDYYVLRETKIPGVLIEMGYITNTVDKKLLKSEKYKNKMAIAIENGIMKYLKK
ncbi:N-acetylmuramoyl-L-alanine amidase [Crassaminicella thermophila]|uniref:N-acetylmuramoyl-L-alanine amidase n=1 Tax=Crassaminicella thermophila TaxID=2599308 RepID=A0A5C0SGV3_CRATE|nr:N-acetylmuramoyl-L-alanine amidase [Crassaminicella thermophila]QEK13430.1 N-acetylmuramoyl-L-alanine amidase [Crassaminicella thermophila]